MDGKGAVVEGVEAAGSLEESKPSDESLLVAWAISSGVTAADAIINAVVRHNNSTTDSTWLGRLLPALFTIFSKQSLSLVTLANSCCSRCISSPTDIQYMSAPNHDSCLYDYKAYLRIVISLS